MSWEFVIALIIAVPLITFPAVFAWYFNAGGLYHTLRQKMSGMGTKRHGASHVGAEAGHNSVGRAGTPW